MIYSTFVQLRSVQNFTPSSLRSFNYESNSFENNLLNLWKNLLIVSSPISHNSSIPLKQYPLPRTLRTESIFSSRGGNGLLALERLLTVARKDNPGCQSVMPIRDGRSRVFDHKLVIERSRIGIPDL